MRAVLHIGTNKTGTSSIQGFLNSNPELLAAHSILYPVTGRGSAPAHHALPEILHRFPELTPQFRKLLEQESDSFHTVVFSSEAFHTYPPASFAEMFDHIPTQVVVYLRPHAEYMSSWWREGVKSRNLTFTFPEFVAQHNIHYAPMLMQWADTFKLDNILIREYNRKLFASGSVYLDFVSKLNVLTLENNSEVVVEENPSISGNLLYFKRQANEFMTEEQAQEVIPEVLELAQLDSRFRGSMEIPADIYQSITDYATDDLQQLSDTFNFTFSDPRPPSGSLSPDPHRISDDFDLIYHHSQARNFQFFYYLTNLRQKY